MSNLSLVALQNTQLYRVLAQQNRFGLKEQLMIFHQQVLQDLDQIMLQYITKISCLKEFGVEMKVWADIHIDQVDFQAI